MENYYGFDLGDAESAIAKLKKGQDTLPRILPVAGAESFITAYATLLSGEVLIGESACYRADARSRKIRFKSRYLTDRESEGDIRIFATKVLSELKEALPGTEELSENSDACFYIGCPAAWNLTARERYREIFEKIGYPPVRIVSESRAALICACQSRYLQVGYDILSKPVLVVDVGSSTTDFAYVEGGSEVELLTAGEVALGGGILDEMLLSFSVMESPEREKISEIFSQSPAWRTYAEFAARRLKEKYFSDEDYWREHPCVRTLEIFYADTVSLTIRMDQEMAARLLEGPSERLEGASFYGVFADSLSKVREKIEGKSPELVFLTGGVSNLPALRIWCRDAFPEAVVVTGKEPQFSVAQGLAYSGRIDDEMRAFRREVSDLIDSNTVEKLVGEHIGDLYRGVVDMLVGPIMDHAVMNVFERWKKGGIERLSDIDEEMKREIDLFLRGELCQKLLTSVISSWLKIVAYELDEHTMPICVRHNIPYRALNLTSYLSLSDVDFGIEARDIFALDEITFMINAILTVIVGLLCGGSGIALIASGFKGIAAGMILSILVLFLGKERMEQRMMDLNIPMVIRRMVSRRQFEERVRRITPSVRAGFYDSLEKEKNEEITEVLVREISDQIEMCLRSMAEIVEIPLGK